MDVREFVSILKDDKSLKIDFTFEKEKKDEIVLEKPYFEMNNLPVKISQFIWKSDEPTLYFTANCGGSVHLIDDEQFGNDLKYLTNTFKSFKIFDKGKPTKDYLFITSSKETKDRLKVCGVKIEELPVTNDFANEHFLYKVYIDKVTFSGFLLLADNLSANDYCNSVFQLFKAKAEKKVINYFIKKIEQKTFTDKYADLKATFDAEYVEFLVKNNINDDGFVPMMEKTSEEVQPVLEVKMKGLSSTPKVEDVITRLDTNKPQTASGELMVDTIKQYREASYEDLCAIIDSLDSYIGFREDEIRWVKYSMYFTDKTFVEFIDRTKQEVIYDNREFTLIFNSPN